MLTHNLSIFTDSMTVDDSMLRYVKQLQ